MIRKRFYANHLIIRNRNPAENLLPITTLFSVALKLGSERKMPRFRRTGAWCLDIEIYLNVSPFVDSVFAALAVHVSLRISAGHFEAGKFPVIT